MTAPSHRGSAVAGVQKPLRQQCSCVPLRHTLPSELRQFWMFVGWANAAIGTLITTVAKSTATLFNFILDLLVCNCTDAHVPLIEPASCAEYLHRHKG